MALKHKIMSRKLASIQTISDIQPIPGADEVSVASVLGWKCVIRNDAGHRIGDSIVFIEPDSILPDRPEFEFMKPRHMRVRTIKLKGQVSQGLMMPVSILADVITAEHELFAALGLSAEGYDVTELLGIIKYEPAIPACLGGTVRGYFPSFIHKTDEERIQNMPGILDKYAAAQVEIREKMDGSSATFYLCNGEFGVCSRNLELKEDERNAFWQYAREMNVEQKLRDYGKNIAIQGELIGEGIQGNKYKLTGRKVLFFNVFDIDAGKPYLPSDAAVAFGSMDLKMVPYIDCLTLGALSVDELVGFATRKSAINPDVWAEGIVVRSLEEMTETFITGKTVTRGRISFKAINPQFLLKYEE